MSEEIADLYQDFFNFFSQEHNINLTISEMNEIRSECEKLENKLSNPKHTTCTSEWHESDIQHFGHCLGCGFLIKP